MNYLHKGLKVILLALLLLLLIYSTSLAVQATGVGVDREHALNSAFRSAIESELGVTIKSTAVSENFMLIKNEIITHSKGYVTSYRIVNETTDRDEGITIVIEAQVDRQLITDHAQTLDILMKMAGHPKVVVFGIDEDLNAVPTGTFIFDRLIQVVSQVFKDKFRFEAVDWNAFRTQNSDIEGGINRDLVIRHNDRLNADLMILVGLNLQKNKGGRQTANARLALKGVRISDNQLVGEVYRHVGPFNIKGLSEQQVYQAAVKATEKDDIFIGAVNLAKKMIDSIDSELDRGHGFQYTISFYDFPQDEKIKQKMAEIQGYVRHKIESKDNESITLAYWSNLKTDTLLEQIQSILDGEQFKYKVKVNQRVLKFKWQHPEDF